MACQGCTTEQQGNDSAAMRDFTRAFSTFWPASLPFPPMAPYLAASVTRGEARAWALAIGAQQSPGVLAGDTQAMLDLIGRALMDPGLTYSVERQKKKRKKKGGSPGPGPEDFNCGISCPDGSSAGVECPDTPCYECKTGCNPSAFADCNDVCGDGGGFDGADIPITEELR